MTSLDELRALEQAATPGPWTQDAEHVVYVSPRCDVRLAECRGRSVREWDDNAALIVAARNALPGLLARVAAAEAERDDAKRIVEHQRETIERNVKWADDSFERAERLADERGALLADVDLALGRYGMAATLTQGASDEQRAAWFEEARLALRRVREVLAAPVPSGPAGGET